ncbi:MAG TPA: Ig-like domain-containing protein [Arachidicoccus soli]|nr:Ig-like domain-containing protein [Arachidicoccus soli]
MKRIFLFLSIIAVFCWLLPTGCAVIVPPSGGPKDTLPPVLLQAMPKDSTLNFKAKTVTLNFDEYVTLDNIFTNLIVSPIPKGVPTVDSHLRTVTIKIKDSLEPNTTYSYNFGKALKDVNEGNVLKNFTYVFSTGDHLDTDSITGKVVLAQTGGVDSSLLAVLYTNLSDTAVLKTSPKYYTTLDSAGRFAFHFLPKKKFNLFIVANSYMKNYNDSTAQFAFLDSTINTNDLASVQNLKLYAFQAYPVIPQQKNVVNFSAKQLEKRKEQEAKKPLTVSTNISSGKQSLLEPLEIDYSKPLKVFDSAKILLTDTNYVPIKNAIVQREKADTTNTQFMINRHWEEGNDFYLIIPKEAAVDSFGVSIAKADTIKFQTKTNHDYATAQLNFPDVDTAQKPVLQIFSSDKMVDSIAIGANREVNIPLFEPGKYHFRILYDLNGDLKWTPGNYQKKIQPEKVIQIKKEFNFITDIINQWDIHLNANPNSNVDQNKPLNF